MEAASAERLASQARRWHSSIKLVDMMKPPWVPWYGCVGREDVLVQSSCCSFVGGTSGAGVAETHYNLAVLSWYAIKLRRLIKVKQLGIIITSTPGFSVWVHAPKAGAADVTSGQSLLAALPWGSLRGPVRRRRRATDRRRPTAVRRH
jgi:hypothetical protein